jgi:catechol 2,3-dioxygenase-like lactoylglutathione lyase family enzyme
MIASPLHVSLLVEDLSRARAFYREGTGQAAGGQRGRLHAQPVRPAGFVLPGPLPPQLLRGRRVAARTRIGILWNLSRVDRLEGNQT